MECIHAIRNSWGSLRQNGFCAICSFCLRTYTIQQAIEAVNKKENVDYMLVNILREKGFIE